MKCKSKDIRALLLRGTISDAIRKVYDMERKSIILPDEMDDEMLYLFKKYEDYATHTIGLSLYEYEDLWDDALSIADMYEGRYL